MPSAAAKIEKPASLEGQDSLKSIVTIFEKKTRNLEKRKGRLEQLRKELEQGKELNEDQKAAVGKYEQVQETLELTKELQKSVTAVVQEHLRQLKRQARREQLERQAREVQRVRELLEVQDVLMALGSPAVRQCFLEGEEGAPRLSSETFEQLDQLYKLVCPDREECEPGTFPNLLSQAAEHLVALLDARPKPLLSTTYKALRDVLLEVQQSTYFSGTTGEDVTPAAPASEEDATVHRGGGAAAAPGGPHRGGLTCQRASRAGPTSPSITTGCLQRGPSEQHTLGTFSTVLAIIPYEAEVLITLLIVNCLYCDEQLFTIKLKKSPATGAKPCNVPNGGPAKNCSGTTAICSATCIGDLAINSTIRAEHLNCSFNDPKDFVPEPLVEPPQQQQPPLPQPVATAPSPLRETEPTPIPVAPVAAATTAPPPLLPGDALSESAAVAEAPSLVPSRLDFFQESQIDLESPHMDPAVVAALPSVPAMALPPTAVVQPAGFVLTAGPPPHPVAAVPPPPHHVAPHQPLVSHAIPPHPQPVVQPVQQPIVQQQPPQPQPHPQQPPPHQPQHQPQLPPMTVDYSEHMPIPTVTFTNQSLRNAHGDDRRPRRGGPGGQGGGPPRRGGYTNGKGPQWQPNGSGHDRSEGYRGAPRQSGSGPRGGQHQGRGRPTGNRGPPRNTGVPAAAYAQ
ncbi:caprin-1-like [Rhipicephalus sanguineus]|uniref:caprin-1-like n=1 Tax=Rhipicephalus sanguineus TaxID=34632 RepID=UPI0018946F25|nr:caprin-1-like [Rhipicephalus sanguineus]